MMLISGSLTFRQASWTSFWGMTFILLRMCLLCHDRRGRTGSSKEEQVARTTVEDFSMTVSICYCQKAAAIDSTHFRVMLLGEIYNIVNIDHMNFRKKSLKFTCRKERR